MESAQQTEKTRLGDILLDKGLINEAQLSAAIESQKFSNLPLGQILIDNEWLTKRQIDQALKVQSKLRSALVSSLIGLSPLALVGCGTSAAPNEDAPTPMEQVDNSGVQVGSSDADDSTDQDVNPDDSSSGGSNSGGGSTTGSDTATGGDTTTGNDTTTGDDTTTGGEDTSSVEPATLGAVEFSWNYPTERADGSDFEVYEIQGFRIYQVSGSGESDTVHEAEGLDTTFMVTELASGEYSFAITVIDVDGIESELSNPVTVTI